MRRTILLRSFGLGLIALLAMGAAQAARAQHRGGAQISMGRGGAHFSPGRIASPNRFGHGQIRSGNRHFDRDHDGDRDRHRGRYRSGYGLGYGYLPYDSGYAYPYDAGYAYPADYYGGGYSNAPSQPVVVVEPPPEQVQAPAPPVAKPPEHAVIEEYKWTAAELAQSRSVSSATSEAESKDFAIVLKDGSTLAAEIVFASGDRVHYVDPDGRHKQVNLSEVDRAATLKLNRERSLNLYLPAAE